MFPFLVLSVVTWFVGKNIKNRPAAGADAKQKADGKSGKSNEAAANAVPGAAAAPAADKLENLLGVDAHLIALGFGLVSVADSRKGGD